MSPSIIAGAVCAISCAGLVACEVRGLRRGRYLFKPVASCAFLAVAGLGGALTGGNYGAWVMIGLVLGALGDVALMFEGKAAFLLGLSAFLAGHLAYVIGFLGAIEPSALRWELAAGIGTAAILVAALALRWLWPHVVQRPGLRGPVVAYVVTITAMVLAAGAVWASHPEATAWATIVLIGAIAFFASDLAVARDKFVAPSWHNRAWGLPAYYGAQLLIALSATELTTNTLLAGTTR